jgi:hypothetical protein
MQAEERESQQHVLMVGKEYKLRHGCMNPLTSLDAN